MQKKDYYRTLWISKNASDVEIKKAYRKWAMKYHPDRNLWDKTAEKQFKEINEAYEVLSDSKKRKVYDNPMGWFDFSQFGWASWWRGQQRGQQTQADFDVWDIFGGMFWWQGWWRGRSQTQNINFDDLFWWWGVNQNQHQHQNRRQQEQVESLDITKIVEVPIFDLILWCKIEFKNDHWKKVKLTIPKFTKPWTKFRMKDKWKSSWWKTGNLFIKVEPKMPKHVSDLDLKMLETIRDNIGY